MSTDENTTAAAPKAPKSSKASKLTTPEQLIYVGPNLPGGRLTQYTVFRGSVPAYLVDLIEKHAEITDLIVPVKSLVDAQSKSKQVGTIENIAYDALSNLSR